MKKQKKLSALHKIALGTAATIASGTLLWSAYTNHLPTTTYSVKSVQDGDSFYLTNGLEIRLANIDAPEIHLCGGVEAKQGLEKLIAGKPITLSIITQDQYHRLVSLVYTDSVLINAEMLRQGLATYPSSTKGFSDIMRNATDEAREKGRGIHGRPCTQKVNTENPACNIKGNLKDGNKYYYPPSCPWYNQSYVQLYLGEQWFCSEKEAINAGYTLAPRCN